MGSFIANIRNVDDWYSVLGKLETSAYQMQAREYLNKIINEGDVVPHVLQYKSPQFIQHEKWVNLQQETVMILIDSNNLAVKEEQIWDSLLKWTQHRTKTQSKAEKKCKWPIKIKQKDADDQKDDEKEFEEEKPSSKEEEDHVNKEGELTAEERELIHEFTKLIRFNQMEAVCFKENIVDKHVLPSQDIIDIMFARENGTKWKSSYNDNQRLRSKSMDSFQLKDVALSLEEIQALSVGDMVDFR